MSNPIRAALFDKDGTLFEFEATWGAWVTAVVRDLAPSDTDQQQRLAEAVGYDLPAARFHADSIVIAASGDEVIATWFAVSNGLSEHFIREVCERNEAALPVVPCGDLHALVAALRSRSMLLGIATNDYHRVAVEHLAAGGLEHAFDHVLGCDSGYGAKPDPGMLLAFCTLAGVEPRATVMVGDSTRDLDAARKAGFGAAVGVLTGPASRAELEPLADVVLDSVAALPDWLATR